MSISRPRKIASPKAPLRYSAVVERVAPKVTDERPFPSRSVGFFERFCAAALLFILFVQPFSTVFAADDAAAGSAPADTAPAAASAPISEPADDTIVAPKADEAPAPEAAQTSAEDAASPAVSTEETDSDIPSPEPAATTDAVTDTPVPVVNDATDTPVSIPPSSSSDNASNTPEAVSTTTENTGEDSEPDATTSDVVATDTPIASTPEEAATTTQEVPATPLPEPEVAPQPDPQDIATTTPEEVTVVPPETNVQTNDSNRYQFGVSDCVTVEDGFFYCSQKKPAEVTGEERFFAAPDTDGDYEIYAEKNDELIQITDNDYDDNAPFYDAESNRLVWHALIDDRYQIMSYDFSKKETIQVTHESYNSMQPSALGDTMVWQAWIENNWEIIMERDGTRTQITQNDTHDIDPSVRGDLILWQHQNSDGWVVQVYNIKTGETETLQGLGGDSLSNPRLMLVYDSIAENGERKTMGYDLHDKTIVPISTGGGSMPDSIPKPAHSQEERALVQPSTNIKEEQTPDNGDGLGSTTPVMDPPLPDLGTATSSDYATTTDSGAIATSTSDTIVISPLATSTPEISAPVDHIETIDLRPASTPAIESDTLATSSIPDLVITPPESTEASSSSGLE